MYRYVDSHSDTLFAICFEDKGSFDKPKGLQINLNSIIKANPALQVFSLFSEDWNDQILVDKAPWKMAEEFHGILAKYKNIKLIENTNEIFLECYNGKIPVILSVEGSGFIESENILYLLRKIGVRMLSLTWSKENRHGYGNSCDPKKGLKQSGKNLVAKCKKLGIIMDVSHINYKGFFDIAEIYDGKPFIASHSNIYRLCPTERNLRDEQVKIIKQVKGVVGITLYTDILVNNRKATIDDIYSHIDYICERYGEDYVGIGTDFDGITELPYGIVDCSDLYKVFDYLKEKGYNDNVITKIASGNFLRVFNKIWQGDMHA
ncbi:MAG: membrane dipeptidase [Candidatus Muirbacterium halophilum]|nr:membrane dipeptidase [Candidatus Muirbacterium halophilum]MCK9476099.1 membrane dipeptidase [Candidatus Muirbacterium halophilum]